jgi:hypothetical protein
MKTETPDRSFTLSISLHTPQICGLELRISLARLEAGQRELQAVQPELHEYESSSGPDRSKIEAGYLLGVQQAVDIHSVLRGIRNVLRILENRPEADGHDRLLRAEAEFRNSFPAAWDLRDILEHLPEYVAGKGKLQKAGAMPTDSNVPNLVYSSAKDPSSEITLLFNFDKQKIEIKAAARKAIEIADLLTERERAATSAVPRC